MFRVVNAFMNHPTLYRRVARSQLRRVSRGLRAWAKMQPVDGAMFREQPHMSSVVLAEMTEAVRAGPAGLVHEASLYHRDWGFELAAIPDHDRGVARSQRPSGDPCVGTLPGRQHPVRFVDAGRRGGPLLDTPRQCHDDPHRNRDADSSRLKTASLDLYPLP